MIRVKRELRLTLRKFISILLSLVILVTMIPSRLAKADADPTDISVFNAQTAKAVTDVAPTNTIVSVKDMHNMPDTSSEDDTGAPDSGSAYYVQIGASRAGVSKQDLNIATAAGTATLDTWVWIEDSSKVGTFVIRLYQGDLSLNSQGLIGNSSWQWNSSMDTDDVTSGTQKLHTGWNHIRKNVTGLGAKVNAVTLHEHNTSGTNNYDFAVASMTLTPTGGSAVDIVSASANKNASDLGSINALYSVRDVSLLTGGAADAPSSGTAYYATLAGYGTGKSGMAWQNLNLNVSNVNDMGRSDGDDYMLDAWVWVSDASKIGTLVVRFFPSNLSPASSNRSLIENWTWQLNSNMDIDDTTSGTQKFVTGWNHIQKNIANLGRDSGKPTNPTTINAICIEEHTANMSNSYDLAVASIQLKKEPANADLSGLTVSSGQLSSAFSSSTTDYSVSVDNTVDSISVTPTVSDTGKATVTVNGSTVSSGSASNAISLNVGDNTIRVVVTGHDGTTTKTYTLTVHRQQPQALSTDSSLSDLTVSAGSLSPSFSGSVRDYAVSVDNTMDFISVTPTVSATGKATVKVNGASVASGAASESLPLDVGKNTISVSVTAEDGQTVTDYTITVNRADVWPKTELDNECDTIDTDHYYYQEKYGSTVTSNAAVLGTGEDGTENSAVWFKNLPLYSGWVARFGTNSGTVKLTAGYYSEISFWVYVSNKDAISSAAFEMGSTDTIDQNEIEMGFQDQLTQNGWNEVKLYLSDVNINTGIDLNNVVRYRLFFLSASASGTMDIALDSIKLTTEGATSNTDPSAQFADDFETVNTDKYTYGPSAELDSDAKQGQHSVKFVSPNGTSGDTVMDYTSNHNRLNFALEDWDKTNARVWVYVNNPNLIQNAVFKLSSAGIAEVDRFEYNFTNQLTKAGWNDVVIPLQSFSSGELDLEHLSYCEISMTGDGSGSVVTTKLDDLRLEETSQNTGGGTPGGVDTTPIADKGVQQASVKANSYDAADTFVATIDATLAPYNADKTGKTDATNAIQNAIDNCQSVYGGGIVYLPKGTYKISGTIDVKSHVTLKGEYNNPDSADGDYGTVISVNTTDSAFTMNAAAGVSGVTVYYPDQSLSSPLKSDYTFKAKDGNFTIENVTMLNSYKGIVVPVNSGVIRLKNIRGTVLNQGINMGFGSEVSEVDGVYFSPSYWANATSAYEAPSQDAIRSWMSVESDCGLDASGLEGPQFSNMLLDGYRTGVRISKSHRSDNTQAYDQFYNLAVKNAVIAVDIDYAFPQMGFEFANSSLFGSSYSLRNSSGVVAKLFNCTMNAPTTGNITTSSAAVSVSLPSTQVSGPSNLKLFNAVTDYGADNTGATDCSAAIQKALNAARDSGGGYVYLPGGIYRMDQPVTVYANTELRGSNAVTGADTGVSAGTSIFSYYGKNKSATDQALITLAGDNAGCTGIRFYYPSNGVTKAGNQVNTDVNPYSYTIRGTADNVYCENLNFYAAYYGIEMDGSSQYIIKNCVGAYYETAIHIRDSTGGVIEGCLSNGGQQGYGSRTFGSLPDFSDWLAANVNCTVTDMYNYLLYGLNQKMLDYIVYDDSTGQFIYNTFAYIPHVFLTATNSQVTGVNLYGSRMGASNSLYRLSGGTFTSVNNYLKVSQVAALSDNAQVGIYNIKGQDLPAGVSEDNLTVANADTTKPVISLPSAAGNSVKQDATFDPMQGVTATDDTDGDITSKVVVSGTVDTTKAGSYTLTYTVTDKAGNEAQATRVITVNPASSSSSSSSSTSSTPDSSSTPSGSSTPSSGSSDTVTFQSDDGKVSVEVPRGLGTVSVQDVPITSDNNQADYTKAANALDTLGYRGLAIHDISLIDENGNRITNLNGKTATVKIKVPDGVSGDLKVFWYDTATGTLTDMHAKLQDGYMVFTTTHFSYYVVAQAISSGNSSSSGTPASSSGSGSSAVSAANPPTGVAGTVPAIILFTGAAVCAVLLIGKRRRSGK